VSAVPPWLHAGRTLFLIIGRETVVVATNTDSVLASAAAKPPTSGFVQERLPFVIATGGEFIGLFFFLAYWDAGSYVLATILLWIGFLIERVVVLGWVQHFHSEMEARYPDQPTTRSTTDFKNKPRAQQLVHLLLICLSEIVVWVAAIFVFDFQGWVAAFAVLVVGEQLQHSWELGLMAHRPIGDYIPTWNALKITLLEAGGGIAWIWLVRHEQAQLGGLFLLIGLSIEHVVQGAKIRVDLEETFKARETAATPVSGAGAARLERT
jgi:hypothetical protein